MSLRDKMFPLCGSPCHFQNFQPALRSQSVSFELCLLALFPPFPEVAENHAVAIVLARVFKTRSSGFGTASVVTRMCFAGTLPHPYWRCKGLAMESCKSSPRFG